jgi:hypothetical protein
MGASPPVPSNALASRVLAVREIADKVKGDNSLTPYRRSCALTLVFASLRSGGRVAGASPLVLKPYVGLEPLLYRNKGGLMNVFVCGPRYRIRAVLYYELFFSFAHFVLFVDNGFYGCISHINTGSHEPCSLLAAFTCAELAKNVESTQNPPQE